MRTHRRERELQVASVVYTEVQSRDEVPANERANTLGDVATCFDADGMNSSVSCKGRRKNNKISNSRVRERTRPDQRRTRPECRLVNGLP